MRPALAEIDQTRTPPNASAGMSRASLALMMEYPPSRRTLLRAGGHAVLFAALARPPAFAAPKCLADPFTLGVASGDPAPDGFVIWTRLAPKPLEPHGGMPAEAVPVGWDVAEDEAFHRIVRTGTALARPELAHSVHVEVEGLGSHRRHWYRFVADGIPSATATATTEARREGKQCVTTIRIRGRPSH